MGVEYADGSTGEWPATIVATDAQHDLAVLRIDAPPKRLRPVRVRALDSKGNFSCLHGHLRHCLPCTLPSLAGLPGSTSEQ